MNFCRATTIATEGPATFGTVVVSTQFPKRSHQMKPSFQYSHLLLDMKMMYELAVVGIPHQIPDRRFVLCYRTFNVQIRSAVWRLSACAAV